ncbi:phage antirepressor KilAC domain-containing protein [Emticicia fluvialis]|uniref:phage antirepressor KilAC domain-containing protein n=1 Tax=Emticicia fluvialis TaxID=2974474 RepID=UPI0021655539|nr:phage antirepressor KilAC domain-containing protein [Emticicia fluvialis]
MAIESKVTFSMEEVAFDLNISRKQLFCILRKYRIIIDRSVEPEFLFMGYFEESIVKIHNGTFKKDVKLVRVTAKGKSWLKRIIPLLIPKF